MDQPPFAAYIIQIYASEKKTIMQGRYFVKFQVIKWEHYIQYRGICLTDMNGIIHKVKKICQRLFAGQKTYMLGLIFLPDPMALKSNGLCESNTRRVACFGSDSEKCWNPTG